MFLLFFFCVDRTRPKVAFVVCWDRKSNRGEDKQDAVVGSGSTKEGTRDTNNVQKREASEMLQQDDSRKKEIYTYQAPWLIYGMNWSVRPDKKFRLALGSFLEDYTNKGVSPLPCASIYFNLASTPPSRGPQINLEIAPAAMALAAARPGTIVQPSSPAPACLGLCSQLTLELVCCVVQCLSYSSTRRAASSCRPASSR
jgi:hypothetical protein